jgi:hypothetical protein
MRATVLRSAIVGTQSFAACARKFPCLLIHSTLQLTVIRCHPNSCNS